MPSSVVHLQFTTTNFMKNFLLLFFLFCVYGLAAQSVTEMEAQLKEATSVSEKLGLKYQIASLLINKDRDKAEDYAKDAFNLAKDKRDTGMQTQVSFLLGRIYEKKRNPRNAKVWFESSLNYAKADKDVDYIIKSVEKISSIYTKDRNYRDAYNVAKDAFQYFSTSGQSVSEMRSNYDVQKAKITRQERDLLKQKEQLEKQIALLEGDRESLSRKNSTLSRKTKELQEEKVQIQDEKSMVEEQKMLIEEENERQRGRISSLTKNQLEAELEKEQLENKNLKIEQLQQEVEMKLAASELENDRNKLYNYGLLGLAGLLILMALLLYARYRSKKKSAKELEEKNALIENERKRSDELLLNILPEPIAVELKENGSAKAQKYNDTTVLFTDFINFTAIAEKLTPEQLVDELDNCFKAFDFIISQYKDIEKIKTIGDAYMAASGLTERRTLPTNIIKAALEMQQFLDEVKAERRARGLPYFEARIGLHTGPVVAGVVGINKFAYDIWGDTVNIAARMESNCEAGKVNVSETTKNLIQYQFETTYRGKIRAKNKGEVDMYYVAEK